jgi:hypothetical protein
VSRFLDISTFDVVVIHYSLLVTSDHYLPPSVREQISHFKGLKVQFIQDEYRWVDEVTAMMHYLGINVLYTCIPEPAATQVYEERLPGVLRIPTLAAYVPQSVLGRPVPPTRERPLDISYRGQTVPFWLGRLGQDKVLIGRGVRDRVARHGLVSDIAWAPEERIYGEEWYRFTAASKAALGTESGASIVDFDGSLQRRVDEFLAGHPEAGFEEVHTEILAPYEENVVINVVSPRVFEAAALKTALVLFPGHHSGIVEASKHYIPLEKDFSNFEEVADLLHQPDVLQEFADQTYADLVGSEMYSLPRFVRELDHVLDQHAQRSGRAVGLSFQLARADAAFSRAIPSSNPVQKSLLCRVRRPYPSRLVADALKLRDAFSSPALRKLFLRYLRGRVARSIPTRQVLADLRKLDIIRRAQLGQLSAAPLQISASFDPGARTLTIRSRRGNEQDLSETNGNERIAEALRAGAIHRIVWDCSQAAPIIEATRNPWLGFVPSPIERFPALEQLARSAPEETAAALEASLFPSR